VKDSCLILVELILALEIIFPGVPNIFIQLQEIVSYPQMFTILVKTVSFMENCVFYGKRTLLITTEHYKK
jgi:hypothetical protein